LGNKRFGEARQQVSGAASAEAVDDTSDQALLDLLKRLKATSDPTTIRQLSNQIERVVFHKQFKNT
jgi:hypothetical protein